MGGKLLSSIWNLPEKRIGREEYFEIRDSLIKIFKEAYPYCLIDTPKVLNEKFSFGDLDALCDLQHEQILKVIKTIWVGKIHINGGVYSFPYKDFQIDIVQTPTKYFEVAHSFFSGGDLGNLLGRVFNGLGCNFGSRGLFFRLLHSYFSGKPEDASPLDKISISTNMEEILGYIGLSYERWLEGFDNEEAVFDFVESSPYFNPRLFKFEELNHQNRSRNKNRPMYCRFVERIEKKYGDVIIPRLSAQYHFPYIIQKWPHILEEIEKHRPRYEKQYIMSKKWTGDMIKEVTGLDGKPLGEFIVAFKESFGGKENFENFILTNSAEKIKEGIKQYIEKNNGVSSH